MKIKPFNDIASHKTGGLVGLTKEDVEARIGFPPNVDDDPYKVRWSWGFTVDGEVCAVWDYKGSADYKEWSAYGSDAALTKVFGNHYTKGAW